MRSTCLGHNDVTIWFWKETYGEAWLVSYPFNSEYGTNELKYIDNQCDEKILYTIDTQDYDGIPHEVLKAFYLGNGQYESLKGTAKLSPKEFAEEQRNYDIDTELDQIKGLDHIDVDVVKLIRESIESIYSWKTYVDDAENYAEDEEN